MKVAKGGKIELGKGDRKRQGKIDGVARGSHTK